MDPTDALEEKVAQLAAQKEAVERECETLRAVNAKMDTLITDSEATVKVLYAKAEQMEEYNAKKREENEALREKLRVMREQLAKLEARK